MAHRLTLPCKEHPMPSPPSWSIARTVRLTGVTVVWWRIADDFVEANNLCIALNRWHPEAWHVPVREDGR